MADFAESTVHRLKDRMKKTMQKVAFEQNF